MDAKARETRSSEGVDVLRCSKYGNPFIVPEEYNKRSAYYKKQGFIRAKSREDAIQSYEDWIRGTAHKDFLPKRRAAIIAGLKSGELQGKTLKYYKPDATDSHAVRLAKLVAEQKAPTKAPIVDPLAEFEISPEKVKELTAKEDSKKQQQVEKLDKAKEQADNVIKRIDDDIIC